MGNFHLHDSSLPRSAISFPRGRTGFNASLTGARRMISCGFWFTVLFLLGPFPGNVRKAASPSKDLESLYYYNVFLFLDNAGRVIFALGI